MYSESTISRILTPHSSFNNNASFFGYNEFEFLHFDFLVNLGAVFDHIHVLKESKKLELAEVSSADKFGHGPCLLLPVENRKKLIISL